MFREHNISNEISQKENRWYHFNPYTLQNQKLTLTGGYPLEGMLHTYEIGADKNSITKMMIAAGILCAGESRFSHVPLIGDVMTASRVLEEEGTKVSFNPNTKVLTVNACELQNNPVANCGLSRLSLIFAGAKVGHYGKADVPLPRGDPLGSRKIDAFTKGLEAFGARVEVSENRLRIAAEHGLKSGHYVLTEPRQTATEGLIFALVKQPGEFILDNTSLVVDEQITFLQKCGANIRRFEKEGKPTRRILIKGVENLSASEPTTQPSLDVSLVTAYVAAALATESKNGIFLEGITPSTIPSLLHLLQEMRGGFAYDHNKNGMWFYYDKPLQAPTRKLVTAAEQFITSAVIGIPTDWQNPLGILFLKAKGITQITEKMFENRLEHVKKLQPHGIKVIFPQPNTTYIVGESLLPSLEFIGRDVRHDIFALLYGLVAGGSLQDLRQVHRGAGFQFIDNLRKLGAHIEITSTASKTSSHAF